MEKLIEQQAVIDCLTNTAKYYDMPQADKWTKGIHYGLLHGLDNILDNVPTVEAIPKADYESRLKANMVAMLVELKEQLREIHENYFKTEHYDEADGVSDSMDVIQQKISELEAADGRV